MNRHNLESNLNSIENIKEKYLNKERLNWMDYYTLAKAYYDHHGNLDIKTSFRTFNGYQEDKDGIKLGTWISMQRLACKGYEYCELSKEKIALLNNLEMIWDHAVYTWNKHYNLAKAYYEHHGNLNIPSNFKTINGYEYDEMGFNVGGWLKVQKAAYNGKIFNNQTEEQIRLLNEIGIVWESGKEYIWNQKYQLAKEYYNLYGPSDVSARYKDENGNNIGDWLDTQRKKYVGRGPGELTDEQIKLLDDIEFNWFKRSDEKYQKEIITSENTKRKQIEILNRFRTVLNKMKSDNLPTVEALNQAFLTELENIKINKGESNWHRNYFLTKVYYNLYGTSDVPARYKDENGNNIGDWLGTQRKKYVGRGPGELTDEQIKLLDDIEFNWFKRSDEKYQKELITPENKGRKKTEITNRVKTSLNKFDGNELPSKEELNQLLMTRLEGYKEKKQTIEDTIEEKKQNPVVIKLTKNEKEKIKWNQNYLLAKDYYDQFGNSDMKVSYTTKDKITIGRWAHNQRNKYIGRGPGKLNDEEIKRLEDIEFNWFIKGNIKYQKEIITSKNIKRKQIEILNRCKTYLNKLEGDTLPTKEELSEGFIKDLEQGCIDEIERLRKSIGGVNWHRNYSLLKEYYDQFGNSDITLKYKSKNGVNTGTWLYNQRKKYMGEEKINLTDDQLKLLDDIEVDWFRKRDKEYQEELITPENKGRKKTEITNRVKTYLNRLESDNLPSKEEITQGFIDQLNKKYVKVKKVK